MISWLVFEVKAGTIHASQFSGSSWKCVKQENQTITRVLASLMEDLRETNVLWATQHQWTLSHFQDKKSESYSAICKASPPLSWAAHGFLTPPPLFWLKEQLERKSPPRTEPLFPATNDRNLWWGPTFKFNWPRPEKQRLPRRTEMAKSGQHRAVWTPCCYKVATNSKKWEGGPVKRTAGLLRRRNFMAAF